jgi:ATP-binding cassette, subfamily B, vacuolar membrane transporter HMT1/ACLQ
MSLVDAKPSPTAAQLWTWVVALVVELLRLATFLAVHQRKGPLDGWNASEVVINVVRVFFILGLVFLYFLFTVVIKNRRENASMEEASPLLTHSIQSNGSAGRVNNYGATRSARQREIIEEDEQPGWVRPEKVPSRSWFEYIRGYSVFFPYLWPSKDRKLQIVVVVCFLLVLVQRGVNVLVPYQLGIITNALSRENGIDISVPWRGIMLYILYRMLQGSNSLIGAARGALWIPVSQYSYRELSVASFEHVHSLSLDFHLGKKTGEVLSALGKGNSINNFLDQVTFQVVPMIIDLTVAIGYFLVAYDAYYALVITIMTFTYGYVTIRLAKWRADARRKMVNADRHQDAVK